jgi:transcriptional regulator with XRE-family HTH domain
MEPKQKREIGERIRNIRMVRNVNQTTFATMLNKDGMATSTVSAYEKGLSTPPTDILSTIAEIGGVSIEDVINGGSRFDDIVGSKAAQIATRRIRNDNDFAYPPSSGDIGVLIRRLDGFKRFIDDVTGRLINEEKQLSLPVLSESENKLITAFRVLSPSKQKRILEDIEEWATTMEQTKLN